MCTCSGGELGTCRRIGEFDDAHASTRELQAVPASDADIGDEVRLQAGHALTAGVTRRRIHDACAVTGKDLLGQLPISAHIRSGLTCHSSASRNIAGTAA